MFSIRSQFHRSWDWWGLPKYVCNACHLLIHIAAHRRPVADYAASKAALINLNESLRYELDKRCVSMPPSRSPHSDTPGHSRYKTPKIRTTLLLPGHTLTPLFSRMSLPSAAWYKFLVPSLPPHAIAKAVIAALDEEESRTICMPFYSHFVRWVGVLPSYGRDFFQWVRVFFDVVHDRLLMLQLCLC